MKYFFFATVLTVLVCGLITAGHGREVQFGQFSVDLPDNWDGEEQTGFVSDNPEEYALTLGAKDESGDHFVAQISIFLLPNKPGADAETAAKTLAEAQGDASDPIKVGNFWQFEGEPRSRTIKGKGLTMVNTTPEKMMIIIAQDPEKLGAEEILASLKGESEVAREMLGR